MVVVSGAGGDGGAVGVGTASPFPSPFPAGSLLLSKSTSPPDTPVCLGWQGEVVGGALVSGGDVVVVGEGLGGGAVGARTTPFPTPAGSLSESSSPPDTNSGSGGVFEGEKRDFPPPLPSFVVKTTIYAT